MSEYDYVVVGTGSAGAVLASRLSEDPDVSVLTLEAGGSEVPPNVNDPSLWFTLLGSDIDWRYTSVPQPGLDGRSTSEPRGKLPGGSSNLYIMMHIRGHPSDFDTWAHNGCPGWRFEDCLPYFQKLENQEDDTNPTAGKSGPLYVANAKLHSPNPTSAAFIEACKELGYPETADFNGPTMEGAGWHHINVKDGMRQSTAVAYLNPALGRPNLTLATNAQATRLAFTGQRCTGVDYVQAGEAKSATARREVVVCAGAMESPKLLMLSGIGAAAQLGQFGIPVTVDLPGVGENFHNHVLTGVVFESPQPVPPPRQNQSESALFFQSQPGWTGPDLQMAFLTMPFDIIIGQGHPNSISILPGIVRPMSRGWIRLASSDPLQPPLVNPNYLGAKADLDRLVKGVELAREIFSTNALAPWVSSEVMPGRDVTTDDDIRGFVRRSADSYHHQAGSCRMGLDELAVVDPQLRVHGTEGLRVCDASVMPTVPSGNCHTAVLMIAERLSEMLRTRDSEALLHASSDDLRI